MDAHAGLSSRRRAKLVKRRTKHATLTPSPLLLPSPLYLSYDDSTPEVRYASLPLHSPCPISPVRPKFTAPTVPASTTSATHALYAAITQGVDGTDFHGPEWISTGSQQVNYSPVRTTWYSRSMCIASSITCALRHLRPASATAIEL